ncbi:DNA (cytosine-5)-methyltransferase 3B [Octopus bimaculoides]|uniref:DNA (cytosine-5-)-methyltransferase n=1 Tax=Octopus bimaculoides TaxID=37653 RepID=A0A0L8HNR6_OCTBM|nr:DNA (cytosine-5)-methyltransferase 3B [Octopus bimaculoides]|eukprot:XP_014770808.1 PREDICTED: DNA (cytosine-5)-methyltransferase 3B-like isoform X1 [Octopus bimaculoides]
MDNTAISTSPPVANTTDILTATALTDINITATTVSINNIETFEDSDEDVKLFDLKRKLHEGCKSNHTTDTKYLETNGLLLEFHSKAKKRRGRKPKMVHPKSCDSEELKEEIEQCLEKKKTKSCKRKLHSYQIPLSPQKDLGNKVCFPVGSVIWGKLSGFKPWPGLVINHEDIQKKSSPLTVWVLWFGDYKISELPLSKVTRFDQYFYLNYKNPSKVFSVAVTEALEVCAQRSGLKEDELSSEHLFNWAKHRFMEMVEDKDPFLPLKGDPYPQFVKRKLQPIFKTAENIEEGPVRVSSPPNPLFENNDLINKLKTNQVKIQEICIGCKSSDKTIVAQHPLFEGGLCEQCKENILETIFALDVDNTHAFCSICSQSGQLCICSVPECNRVYCINCIQSWVGCDAWDLILSQNPWSCFLCRTPNKRRACGYLQAKPNWSLNIMHMFNSHQKLAEPNLSYLTKCPERPPIRVLSLFDGIGTGKVALDQLGLTIKEYFSSEVDADALIVKRFTYGQSIKEIGDITELTEVKLSELCPLDLVIGGSPCNDLSLVNPARKGFSEEGTGILFFEFCRILSIVQRLCKDRHVFWLYENVAAMKTSYKNIISRFLGCKPALWDAKFFSAQHRPRYFWGNLPTIYSSQPTTEDDSLYLDKILSPNCNRKARVKQLRTVTTRSNSLRQGKNENILPVEMDGEEDAIWITELEKIFGFPTHYTDVRNLNHSRRQRLLGRAWSVPVIKFLLSPLTKLFHTAT